MGLLGFNGLKVIRDHERSPPAPLGDGRGEAPGWGFGGDAIAVERASARRGVGRLPHGGSSETGNRASIRTCSGRCVAGGRVHDLIQCFRVAGEKGGMLLSCSRTWWPLERLRVLVRRHPAVTTVLTHHRSHPESSKLFHLGENPLCLVQAAWAGCDPRKGS